MYWPIVWSWGGLLQVSQRVRAVPDKTFWALLSLRSLLSLTSPYSSCQLIKVQAIVPTCHINMKYWLVFVISSFPVNHCFDNSARLAPLFIEWNFVINCCSLFYCSWIMTTSSILKTTTKYPASAGHPIAASGWISEIWNILIAVATEKRSVKMK